MAPEVLERKQVSYKSDLWSLGIVLFYMIFRRLPFYSKQNLLQTIREQTDPYFNLRKYFKGNQGYLDMINLDLEEFFKKVLVFDINKRIAFKDLFNLTLIEQQMKEEDQKLSFLFYSNLDNNFGGVNSPYSIIENLDAGNHTDQKKLFQDQPNAIPSKQIIESTKLGVTSTSNNKIESRSSYNMGTIQIQINTSSIYDDVPEDDSPNIQSIYPSKNLTQFDKRKQQQSQQQEQQKQHSFVNQISNNLDPNKIYIQPTHFTQSRQSISFLEQLNPKRFSYDDVLTPNIFSDFEIIPPNPPNSRHELDPSNQDIFQICSQIKTSILNLFSDEFSNEHQFEINQIRQTVFQYQLLDEILIRLNEFRLGYSTQCLLNFIISKQVLFIIHNVSTFFQKCSEGFQQAENAKKIKSMLQNDLKSWENKLFVYRNGIDLENDIKQQSLRDMIIGDSSQPLSFNEFVQPFCIILELLFSISFQLSEQNSSDEKVRFRKYCFYLILIISVQNIFNKSKEEKRLFEEYFVKEKDLHPYRLISHIESIDSWHVFDTLLQRFINFCPLSIPNIRMIDNFQNRKFF